MLVLSSFMAFLASGLRGANIFAIATADQSRVLLLICSEAFASLWLVASDLMIESGTQLTSGTLKQILIL